MASLGYNNKLFEDRPQRPQYRRTIPVLHFQNVISSCKITFNRLNYSTIKPYSTTDPTNQWPNPNAPYSNWNAASVSLATTPAVKTRKTLL